MPDENKIRDAADAIKGIAEAVPVYPDVVQPAAKEIGIALQTVAKTIHIALLPLRLAVWGYDQIEEWLLPKLAERLRDVPENRIQSPMPTIAGPALEALRFAGQDSTLRELYAKLLATSMDAQTARKAHPAFVEIIRQLIPDEAQLLEYLWQNLPGNRESAILISGRALIGETMVLVQPINHFCLMAKKVRCVCPDLIPSYIDNLCRLGLTSVLPPESAVEIDLVQYLPYEHLEEEAKVDALQFYTRLRDLGAFFKDESNNIRLEVTRGVLSLTSLGTQFCEACIDYPESV